MAYINGQEVLFSAQVMQANSNVDVDTEMSDTSENPVENKAIKNYIDSEVAALRDDHNLLYEQVQNLDVRAATTTDLGFVFAAESKEAAEESGIFWGGGNGGEPVPLTVLQATEEQIAARENAHCPIVPANLEYAVKSVGDGYYATTADVGDVEAALDSILAMQESLIGGDA